MSEVNTQNVEPVEQVKAQPQGAPAANVTPTGEQVVSLITPKPTTQEPAENPLFSSKQTQNTIKFMRDHPEVLAHINEQVALEQPDFNPMPDQFVSRKQYEIDKAIAKYGLTEADAALLEKADISVVADLAARLAPVKAEGGATVKPTAEAKPEKPQSPQMPQPPSATGKVAPPDLGASNLLADAFTAFKGAYQGGK